MKVKILSWLLHHANRNTNSEHFYKIKNELLKKYGICVSYDVQFIEGKACWTCAGTGIYVYYGNTYPFDRDETYCWHCINGWYKRPVWNVLKVIRLGKYLFHQPKERLYSKPEGFTGNIIKGYVDHDYSKYGDKAEAVLYLLFDTKRFLKVYFKTFGLGWRVMWYKPNNFVRNIVHLIRYKKDSYVFRKWRYDKIESELPF